MRRCYGLLVVMLLALARPAGPAALAQDQASDWAYLGPPGPAAVTALAVSPSWPDDPLLLGWRGDHLVRTRDGGQTWQRLAAPVERVSRLTLAPAYAGTAPAFAVAEVGEGWQVFSSPDAGQSWRPVVESPARPELSLSPDFSADGLALLSGGGRLYRSRDGGASWEEVSPPVGAWVQQAAFSPAYARDRTIFLAVTSGGFPSAYADFSADGPAGDHEASPGVVVSTDGGESWTVRSGGLEVGGRPYRHVQRLAVSPTFDQDGTLFAYAWGPRESDPCLAGRRGLAWRAAVFRSADAGETWEVVRTSGPSCYRASGELALSPTFAQDGVVLLAESSSSITPASSSCDVHRGADRGTTWQRVLEGGSYEGCDSLQMVGTDDGVAALVLKKGGWRLSLDGGQSWSESGLELPGNGSRPTVSALAVTPRLGAQGAIFAGGSYGGVWARGSNIQATSGQLPCPAEAVRGFGRALAVDGWVRLKLGCPLEAERAVRIRERRAESSRAYWTEDERPIWFELSERSWSERPKDAQPWPVGSDRWVDGAVQEFEGGTMLWVPRAEGRPIVLVLIPLGHYWRELPD